ncbi:MAG: NAD(+)/NADH kinase [Pseudomonadales bacterium]
MAIGTIGIIANPASGKDVRRLVARASVFDNQEKQAIVRRALSGIAAAAGRRCRIAYFDDLHGITRRALEETGTGMTAEAVSATRTASAMDTVSAARAMQAMGCSVVLTLGGDGTNRAVCGGWQNAPLIAISTGTNNVFPSLLEATVAGAAAGLIGSGQVCLDEVAEQRKRIHVEVDGQGDDLALIDAVLSSERFLGSRALLEPDALRTVLLTRADPAAVGMTALGGLLHPLSDSRDAGLLVQLAPGSDSVNVPIAPGYYRPVSIASLREVGLAETVTVAGPGVLAFDGERERELKPGQRARWRIERTGPRVVDVARALQLAAERGAFRTAATPPGAGLYAISDR